MPTNSENLITDPRRWVQGIWPAALAQGLEAMLGAKVGFDCLPIESVLPAGSPEDCWWRTEFSGAGGASVYCGCTSRVADKIGKAALTAVGVSESSAVDAKRTYQEIVGQSISAVALALGHELKRDAACINGRECQQPADCHFFVPVKLDFSGQECGPVWLAVSREFEALFTFSKQVTPAVPNQRNSQPKTMDLLFDVELPVSVSFGRTQLPLKDVIKLTTGSILELNRSISEPVELIVNNCVIARGEVVVIEGNYAIRIQQIISRQERLRTLY